MESIAPLCAVALSNANTCTAASVGPIQGVHPIPNENPTKGAKTNPTRDLKFGLKLL